MWGDYGKIKNPPRYETIVLDSDKENPEELSIGSITTINSPRNNFELGRALVPDPTPTEISIPTPTANLQSVSTPRLGPTTRSMTRADQARTSVTQTGPVTRSMTRADPSTNLSASITRSLNTMSTRLQRELRNLDTSEIDPTNLMEHALVTGLTTGPNLPKNFDQAWNHEDPTKRTLWRNSILKELQDMNKRKVFLLLLICHVPVDRILIGNKWVLVIKKDGRHQS